MASVTGSVIRVDEQELRGHLDEVVRTSVEETLNGMLDAEADRLCQAKRYERTAERVDTRAGSYERKLQTKAGEVKLKVPRLRSLPFETQIIERYRRRESSVEEALMEMYLAGVSVRRVEDITEALWGTRVSPSTVSELNQQLYERIEAWRNQPITRPVRLRVPGWHLAEALLGWRGEESGRAGGDWSGPGRLSSDSGRSRRREGRRRELAAVPAAPQRTRVSRCGARDQ